MKQLLVRTSLDFVTGGWTEGKGSHLWSIWLSSVVRRKETNLQSVSNTVENIFWLEIVSINAKRMLSSINQHYLFPLKQSELKLYLKAVHFLQPGYLHNKKLLIESKAVKLKCQQGLLRPTEISISWQCQKFPYLQMLPAAKKKNMEHTWETSRTPWVCETIGKLSLRGGTATYRTLTAQGNTQLKLGLLGPLSSTIPGVWRKRKSAPSSSWEGSLGLSLACVGGKAPVPLGQTALEQQPRVCSEAGDQCSPSDQQHSRNTALCFCCEDSSRGSPKTCPETTTEKTQSSRNCWAGLIRLILPKGCGAHSHNTTAGSWERICIPSVSVSWFSF